MSNYDILRISSYKNFINVCQLRSVTNVARFLPFASFVLTAPGVIYEPNIFLYYEADTPLCVPGSCIYCMSYKLSEKFPFGPTNFAAPAPASASSSFGVHTHKSPSRHNQADFHICLSPSPVLLSLNLSENLLHNFYFSLSLPLSIVAHVAYG